MIEPSWTSLVPALLAVILAFVLRDALISLLLACLVGVLLMGQGFQGLPGLITRSLGNEDFIWLCAIELCIGVLVAFLQRSGAIDLFREQASRVVTDRKRAGVMGWALGLSVFFSDYFSPLFVGAEMRDITDRFRISREKLPATIAARMISSGAFSEVGVHFPEELFGGLRGDHLLRELEVRGVKVVRSAWIE